jgi:hypothetical protein
MRSTLAYIIDVYMGLDHGLQKSSQNKTPSQKVSQSYGLFTHHMYERRDHIKCECRQKIDYLKKIQEKKTKLQHRVFPCGPPP